MTLEQDGSTARTPLRSEPGSIRWLAGLAVVQTLALLALLVVMFRIETTLESIGKDKPIAQPSVADKVLDHLARFQKNPEQSGDTPQVPGGPKPAAANPTGLTFRSVAVLPAKSKIDAEADAEAAKVGPALTLMLQNEGKVKVIPFEKVTALAEKDDPVKAAKSLEAGAILATEVRFYMELSLKVELIEAKTGLALWAQTFELGRYSSSLPEWKQKLTESLRKIVAETEARSGGNP
jgi:TolB-like protein